MYCSSPHDIKSIGICTMYYNNLNYGANLQAYALCSIIDTLGYQAEVIPFRNRPRVQAVIIKSMYSLLGLLSNNDDLSRQLEIRKKAVDEFRDSIPHSKLYYADTINKANGQYDLFVTGSDQVWNPNWINRYLSLEFTDGKCPTVAYAASLGKIELNREQQEKLKIALQHTNTVSIRERESIPALSELTDKPIEYVLDPTLLLSKDQWNDICTERIIREDYIFCYFLSGNENLRKVADEYAKQKGLKIVTLPYLNGKYRKVDDGFGDHCLFDVSPKDFLSLIKHTSFVMTDSFHATVFSHLFEREFVSSGGGKKGMGCRMMSLTELFGTEERYFTEHDDVTLEKLLELDNKPLVLNCDKYIDMKDKSLEFLKRALAE